MSARCRTGSKWVAAAGVAGVLGLLAGCGGGGKGPQPGTSVHFTGFTFQIADNAPTSTPPMEDLTSVPPTLGAPLDVRVIFNFDGVPQGPFTQASLPVFTTPAQIPPASFPPAGSAPVMAKGNYVLVGNTVEFRPFFPVQPLSISLASSPESVPGFLPGTIYTAQVTTAPGSKIPNLVGAGGTVQFGTTSNPASYFSGGTNDGKPPVVTSTEPAEGTLNFSPGPFNPVAPGATAPTFPAGPSVFTLTLDHPLLPTSANLFGSDIDGDGLKDPNFFVRSRATRLLVAHTVPASSSVGSFSASFPAVSGLLEGQAAPPSGSAIFLHNSQGPGALPGGDAALVSTPSSLAVGADPSLLFVVLAVDGGNDQLTVVDHVLGDPSFAEIAAAPAVDTQLADLVGLLTTQDGRLIGYDRATRQIYELLPTVVRDRPVPGDPVPGKPVLTGLSLGTGAPGGGFRSAVFPAGVDVVDLAQTPSGDLYALVDTGGTFEQIQRLNAIDFDLNDTFQASDGLPAGAPVFSFTNTCAAIEFTSDEQFLALNRTEDTIDRMSLTQGKLGTAVSQVAAFGVPLAAFPGGLSPATAMTFGFMAQDVGVTLLKNDITGSTVRLDPLGVLPIDADIEVMQRNLLSALSGVSLANADAAHLLSALGSRRVLGVSTSAPSNPVDPCGVPDPEGRVTDAFVEDFGDKNFEDTNPPSINPQAEWAKPVSGSATSGHLQASVGQSAIIDLGDFKPLPSANFNPQNAYLQVPSTQKPPNFTFVILNTDVQSFPMPNGATPGVTTPSTVVGGHFTFRDFIIPEGVWVIARGDNPLVITATGKVEIRGVLDCSGNPGVGDVTFDTGFTPVPGGLAGPGGGRGGESHPTTINPNGPQQINQYATPAAGARGFGPVVGASGAISFERVGGHGGVTTLGYIPEDNLSPFPYLPGGGMPPLPPGQGANTEHSRPPGGGGGSFYYHGMRSHNGSGSYRVESTADSDGNITNVFFPSFKLCPNNDKIRDSLYGNDENRCQGNVFPSWPLQCVFMMGTPENPVLFQPAAEPGRLLFKDGDPENDFFGPGGELQVLIGGQGGGGGGTRIDSMVPLSWACSQLGAPCQPPIPCYPALFGGNVFFSPTLYDAKGGGGGGGGGSLLIRSLGDILVSRMGHIDCSGGDGAGGETITSSNYSGGGGGGSGGAIILQAAGNIRIEADATHNMPGFMDLSGAQGASLDVSGGYGADAIEDPKEIPSQTPPPGHIWSRSDGGQGGFGLIQLQQGSATPTPTIQQGAFLFARVRAPIKLGPWTDIADAGKQIEHPSWPVPPMAIPLPDALRYIDMLDYRWFHLDPQAGASAPPDFFFLLNGADPPLISVTDAANVGPYQLDTPMMDYFGKRVVKESQPHKIMKTYFGWDPTTFVEPNTPPPNGPPGILYETTDVIPFSVLVKEPDGTPLKKVIDGQEQFDPEMLVDRLPVVSPTKTPPPIGTVSRGTSVWLDYAGAALRARKALVGTPPPFFAGMNGTYNGMVPPDKDSLVITAAVANAQAHFVANSGSPPFDPGLCTGGAGFVPFNDIKVDAPDIDAPLQNAISDNASVGVRFQGAYPVRAGSHVPDPTTLTAWVSDLRELSGYPLIRFQVTFDLVGGIHGEDYPFGADSFRPSVDTLRVRAEY